MHHKSERKDGAILVLRGSDFPYWIARDLISPNYILLVTSLPTGNSEPQATHINHRVKPNLFLDCFNKESFLIKSPWQPNPAFSAVRPTKAFFLFCVISVLFFVSPLQVSLFSMFGNEKR